METASKQACSNIGKGIKGMTDRQPQSRDGAVPPSRDPSA
jgi:hypothetical protein